MQTYFYLDTLPAFDQEQMIQGNCQIVLPFFFSLFLNDFISKLNTCYPKINIKCYENTADYSIHSLYSSDKVHLLLGTPDQKQINKEKKLISYCLGHTSVSVCVNRSSQLAQKCVLTQEDIYAHLQTTYPQDIWNNNLLTGNNILFTSSNIYQHLDSVIKNDSVCIVPTYIQSGIAMAYPEIILIPIDAQFLFPIYIVHSKEHVLDIVEKAVVRFLAQYVQVINAPNATILSD